MGKEAVLGSRLSIKCASRVRCPGCVFLLRGMGEADGGSGLAELPLRGQGGGRAEQTGQELTPTVLKASLTGRGPPPRGRGWGSGQDRPGPGVLRPRPEAERAWLQSMEDGVTRPSPS